MAIYGEHILTAGKHDREWERYSDLIMTFLKLNEEDISSLIEEMKSVMKSTDI